MRFSSLFLSFSLIACGTQTGPTVSDFASDDAVQSALESDAGGLDETDSDPLPEDAEASGATEAEATDDAIPELTETETQKGAYFVRIAWGNFPVNKANAGARIDYSGSLSVDADDTLRRVRAWHFEKRDGIERPRDSKSAVAFASHITVASDGLHALVLTPDSTSKLVVKLGGEAGSPVQFEKTYDLTGSLHLRETSASATTGQEVRISIDRVEPGTTACEGGSLVGEWNMRKAKDGREVAVLKGRLLRADGQVIAKLVGLAGVRKNGNHVFFMKIGRAGHFISLVKGTYDPAALSFEGKALGRGKVEIGAADGTYTATDDAAVGSFEGKLALTACQP
jgi:hypothetical protein